MADPRFHGPTGTSDRDRLYILCYDHTDWHCGRFNTDYIFGRHFFCDHAIPYLKYPALKIGNQFGGGYYDYLASLTHDMDKYRFQELLRLIREHQCDLVGGTYSQPISAFLNEEVAIRQFTYGLDSIEKYTGIRVRYYAFSENTGWYYLPQILNDFGFEGALLRSHYQPMGYPAECDTSFVDWVGPDNSRIETIPSYEHDNLRVGQHGLSNSEAAFMNWYQYVEEIETLPTVLDNLNRYYDEKKEQGIDYVVMASVEDFNWHVTFDQLFPMLDEIDPKHEKYCFVTLEEVIGILKANHCPKPAFDPKPNLWSFAHNAGYIGGLLTQMNTLVAGKITGAETLTAFAAVVGKALPSVEEKIDFAYKQHLCAEAHDGYEVPETTDIAIHQLMDANRAVTAVQEQALQQLTENIQSTPDSIAIFNTQCYDRTEPVQVAVPHRLGYRVCAIYDPQNCPVAFDILTVNEQETVVSFLASVPAFGHSVYRLQRSPGTDKCTMLPIDQQDFTAVSPSGTLVIKDRHLQGIFNCTGEQIIEQIDLSAVIYDLDCPSNEQFYKATGAVTEICEGKTAVHITTAGMIGAEPFQIVYTVYKSYSAIDVTVSYTCNHSVGIGTPPHSQGEAWGESNENFRHRRLNINLKPAFSFAPSADRNTLDYPPRDPVYYNEQVNLTRYTPFYPEEFKRENDFNTFQSAPHIPERHIYDINSRYWAVLSDQPGNKGLIVCAKGNEIMTYDGWEWSFVQLQATKYVSSVFRFGKERNELLGENLPEKVYRHQYRLVPHNGKLSTTEYMVNGKKADVHRMGLDFNVPFIVRYCPDMHGSLPLSYQYICPLSLEGTAATTVKSVDDAVYVRIYEYAGTCHPLSEPLSCVSMDYRQKRPDTSCLEPYKIITYTTSTSPERLESK